MFQSMANLMTAAGAAALLVGVGHVLLNLMGLRRIAVRERILFAFAVGLIAVGLVTLALGHAGLLYHNVFRIAAGAGLLLVAPALVRMRPHDAAKGLVRKALDCPLFEKVLIVLILAQVCAMLLTALAPPVGADALAYHLAVPKIYIENHGILNLPNHKHSSQPFLMEMIFLFGMLIKGDVVAQLLNFASTCAAGLSIYVLARRFFSRRVGIIASAVFLLTPQLLASVELMGPESGMALVIALAFLALTEWAGCGEPAERRSWVILVAVLSSGVAGMKQSGAGHAVFFGLLLIVLPLAFFHERLGAMLRHAALYAAITAVLGGGWYVRCWAMSGNPLHPFGTSAPMAPNTHTGGGRGGSLVSLVAYPWNLTMHSRSFGTLATDNPGPLPLAFIPVLLLLLRPVPRWMWLMLGYCAVFAGAIFFTSQITRYLIPIFGLTAIAVGVAVERFESLGKLAAYSAATAVILAGFVQAGLSARAVAGDHDSRLRVVLGGESREEFLAKASYSYSAFDFLNGTAGDGSRVLLLYGHEAYYLDLPYLIAGFTMVGSPLEAADYESDAAFAAAVRALAVDYVFVDEYVRDLFYPEWIQRNPHVIKRQEHFLGECCRLVFRMTVHDGKRILIYRLQGRRLAASGAPGCGGSQQ